MVSIALAAGSSLEQIRAQIIESEKNDETQAVKALLEACQLKMSKA